jgi:TusA-related sulfurtransferase
MTKAISKMTKGELISLLTDLIESKEGTAAALRFTKALLRKTHVDGQFSFTCSYLRDRIYRYVELKKIDILR